MNKFYPWFFFIAASLATAKAQISSPGTVYLVVGSDTAIWNAVTTVDVYSRHPHYSQSSFSDTNAPVFQVMDPAWRDQFKDSFGQPIKFTWWMMGGNIYREADNLNVPVANTMTLHLMKQYHGDAIRQFGDELSLHYHTYLWSDFTGSGTFYWNQSQTFNQSRADFDFTLSQYLLEEGIFPVSFRSGWHFMDQDWQNYLNQLIPYCFHDNYPAKIGWYTNVGPIAGVEDWSHAPTNFIPFHPATNDYQLPGNGAGWNVRSVKIQALTQTLVDQMFTQAATGTDQVACLWDHLPESFVLNITKMAFMLNAAASNNPAVKFRFCTAVEAMQRWRGLTNQAAPVLDVGETTNGIYSQLSITSSIPIFQEHPFVCLRDAFQQYTNISLSCRSIGSNAWSVVVPVPRSLLAKVGIAVTDTAGNVATRILRYLPDDLFLDDLDSQYTAGQGHWSSITNSSWGTDARVCSLATSSVASANWALPLSGSGRYHISTQVPGLLGAATNVAFQVWAADSNIFSVILPAGIPTNQWAFLGSVVLDQSLSNRVEMVVDGTNQANAYAIADVLRIVPAPETMLPLVGSPENVLVFSTGNKIVLRLAGHAGHSYLIQRGDSLQGSWSTLQIATPSISGLFEYEDERPSADQAFYRVLEQ